MERRCLACGLPTDELGDSCARCWDALVVREPAISEPRPPLGCALAGLHRRAVLVAFGKSTDDDEAGA